MEIKQVNAYEYDGNLFKSLDDIEDYKKKNLSSLVRKKYQCDSELDNKIKCYFEDNDIHFFDDFNDYNPSYILNNALEMNQLAEALDIDEFLYTENEKIYIHLVTAGKKSLIPITELIKIRKEFYEREFDRLSDKIIKYLKSKNYIK